MPHDQPFQPALVPGEWAAIEDAVKKTAWQHLRAEDADTALSFYLPDAVIVSEGEIFPSFESFAEQTRAFYSDLVQVHVAVWDDMRVLVLSDRVALLSASFRWSSTDTAGVRTELKGAWTAVYVRCGNLWRISVRHESFAQTTGEP